MSSVPGRDQDSLLESPDHAVGPSPAPESESDWKSTADAVEEPSDPLPPLKSVIGGLSAILTHCGVRSISPELSRS